ncbi:MAG TPA: ABC transporter ATP-binding protein [Acidimicrobiales bacterium]|nr:ABC transporter ATP-binding protein [Acidimicrobiales bacterium]
MSARGGRPSRAGWQLLARAVKDQRNWVALGVTAGLVWTAAKVAVPTLAQLAIDRGIIASNQRALLEWSLAIFGVGIVSAVCTGLRRYYAFGISYRAETDLRDRLFAHLQRLHFAFHDHAQTGQLMARAATDLLQVQSFLTLIPITIGNALTVSAVVVILFVTNAGLAALALAALPLINIVAKRFGTRIHPVSLELQERLAGVAEVVEETVVGVRVVKGFGAESIQAAKLGSRVDRVFDRAVLLGRMRASFMPLLDFLPAMGLVAVLWYGGHQVLSGHLSVGELVAFMTYILMLIAPLRMLGMIIAMAQRAVASATRIDEVLATHPVIVDRPDGQALPPGHGELRFDQVTFAYLPPEGGDLSDAGVPVLDRLDLVVRPGEAVALVGATGSGKSTVARLIPRFYEVLDGSITIDGANVRDLRLRELRRAVGIVFEETFLFSDSIRSNIAFADPDAPQEAIEWAARRAGLHDFVSELPDGYDTVVGGQGFALSGGQRQRVALARAILADPRILILDDATSSVDPTKEHEIREALSAVMRGRTTIVIAHRPATVALADRVVLLDRGRIVAEGTHSELLATSERYRRLLAQQVESEVPA